MKRIHRAPVAAIGAWSAIALLFLLSSCSNLFSRASGTAAGDSSGYGSLKLVMSLGGEARTVSTADFSSYIKSYGVRLSRSGSSDITASAASTGSLTMNNLPLGTYTVTVLGLNADGEVAASGSASGVTVSSGTTTTTASITLSYIASSGYGDLQLSLFFPTSAGVDSAEASLTASGVATAIPLTLADTGSADLSRVDVAMTGVKAGSPLLSIALKKGGITLATVNEVVWVFKNLPTVATITLSASAFGSAPSAPKNLALTRMDDGSVVVSWTGTSYVADGYLVGRSVQGSNAWTSLGSTSDPALRYYRDSGAVAGTAYYYRVAARNRFGVSGYASAGIKVESPSIVALCRGNGNDGGVYLMDGVTTPLAEIDGFGGLGASRGYGIAASGRDIYVAGAYADSSENTRPCYWKNGVGYALALSGISKTMHGGAYGVALCGSDLYCVGLAQTSESCAPVYWKNGSINYLPMSWSSDYFLRDPKIVVSGGDVYIVGHYYYDSEEIDHIVYWKNGVLHDCTPSNAGSDSITIYAVAI
jgi:Fibronectin type III domain.